MRKDMRLTMPLWQMGAIVLTIILTLIMGKSTEIISTGNGSIEFEFTIAGTTGYVFIATTIVFFLYMFFFLLRIYQHNQRYPEKRINAFSFKPQEYIEEPQVFDELTKRATKKVYSYYSWVLPIFVGVSLITFCRRTMILIGILVIALGQYWIYYASIQNNLRKIETEEKT